MKTLYLLRHAEARSPVGFSDAERELTDKGRLDADTLGQVMLDKGYNPALIYCSPSMRTRQTLAGVQSGIGAAAKVEFPERLYNASRGDILRFIQSTDDNVDSILVVAHNPGIYELVATLADDAAPAMFSRLNAGYKPATLSVFACDIEKWADIQPAENSLTDFLEAPDFGDASAAARRA